MKMPKTLAEVADLYYVTRDKRLTMEKEAAKIQQDETALKEYLIANLPKSKAEGVAGKLCRVQITRRDVPKLADPKKFYAFAARKGNEDLAKESMVASAVQARWENGIKVPGVEAFTLISLSLNKA